MSTSAHQGTRPRAGRRDPQRALSIVIVDDERLARQRLRRLLGNIAAVEVVAECSLGAEAVETALRLRPDVMLLDIQMPDVDGFGTLERMLDKSERQGYDAAGAAGEGPRVPLVIFVTAFDEYALRAFDVHAVDYVLKPVDEARLAEAIERAHHTLRTTALAEAHERLMVATETLIRSRRGASGASPDAEPPAEMPVAAERGVDAGPPTPITDRLYVRHRGRGVFVRIRDIDVVEARGNYALIYAGAARHMLRDRMVELQRLLEPHGFARIHRSAIVNLDRVKEIIPQQSGDSIVVLRDGTRLRFSRWYRERFESRVARGRDRPQIDDAE